MKKAVILAAGKGKRLGPLTSGCPKPMLRILDKSVMEHNLEQLSGLVEEIIIIVGHCKEEVEKKIGKEYEGLKIRYIEQAEPLGTGHAAKLALPFIEKEALFLNGDDIYFRDDLEKCLAKKPAMLVKEVSDPSQYGQVRAKEGLVKEIVEKPKDTISNLVNTGCSFLPKSAIEREIEKSPRGEYEFVDFLQQIIKEDSLYCIVAQDWFPVTYPWSVSDIARFMLNLKEEKKEGVIEEGALIEGKVIMEKGSIIKTGSIITGPVYLGKGTVVGPGAHIREYTILHDDCFLGRGAEIKNSIVFSRTRAPHFCYIGDSLLGEQCNIGAGVVLSNSLLRDYSIKVIIEGKTIDTRRRKWGAVLGNGVKVGANVLVMPGIMVGENALIYPHTLVKRNIEEGEKFKGE